jgi:uncharacterized protein DUF6519
MGSDRARVSYDPRRQYRAVVAQQGRATTEADTNEAWTIDGEQTREEILDIVGLAGTPDDGYRVIPPGAGTTPPFQFDIGPGTMYMGGIRAFLPTAVRYTDQDEWLDRIGDPDWVPPTAAADPKKARELVYLDLVEQEVSATEDRALLEVALGGPDTSQRVRLIQRIKRLGTDAQTCEDALTDAEAVWATQALTFDPATMRLDTTARLQVSFTSTGIPPDPCEPEAQGGYLGADNQLIRVQVTAWDPATNTGRFVWGFDDASFLYRVDVVNRSLVELQSRPPDDVHQPRAGQVVELLRSAVRLSNADDFIASATGILLKLPGAYRPDTRRITLPSSLPATYADSTRTPAVFLRVWEEEHEFTPGKPVTLVPPGRPTTGLQVTLTTAGGRFHPGDFWLVGVRPAAPTQIYPARYLLAPQPPDGPRQWACPLAVVQWQGGLMEIVGDCRKPFDNLVELTARPRGGGDCITVGKGGNFEQLKDALDRLLPERPDICLCLLAGDHDLTGGLVIGARLENQNLRISGCGPATRLKLGNTLETRDFLSVGLHELTISGKSTEQLIHIVDCLDVQLSAVRIAGTAPRLIEVGPAERFTVYDSTLHTHHPAGIDTLQKVAAQVGFDQLAEVSEEEAHRDLLNLGGTLASLPEDARKRLAQRWIDLAAAPFDPLGGSDPLGRSAVIAMNEVIGQLEPVSPSGRGISGALLDVRRTVLETAGAVALRLPGGIPTTIRDSEIIGLIGLGGHPALPLSLSDDELSALTGAAKLGRISLNTVDATLRIAGNHLTGVAVREGLQQQLDNLRRAGGGPPVDGLYAESYLTDNVFTISENSLIGKRLNISGNVFTHLAGDVGLMVGDTAVYTANQTAAPDAVLYDATRLSHPHPTLANVLNLDIDFR